MNMSIDKLTPKTYKKFRKLYINTEAVRIFSIILDLTLLVVLLYVLHTLMRIYNGELYTPYFTPPIIITSFVILFLFLIFSIALHHVDYVESSLDYLSENADEELDLIKANNPEDYLRFSERVLKVPFNDKIYNEYRNLILDKKLINLSQFETAHKEKEFMKYYNLYLKEEDSFYKKIYFSYCQDLALEIKKTYNIDIIDQLKN